MEQRLYCEEMYGSSFLSELMSRFCFFGLFHKDERNENLKTEDERECCLLLVLWDLSGRTKISDKIGNCNSLFFRRRLESLDSPHLKKNIFYIAFPNAIKIISNIPPPPPQSRNSPKWIRDSSLSGLHDQK
jgi:hypothetical protein